MQYSKRNVDLSAMKNCPVAKLNSKTRCLPRPAIPPQPDRSKTESHSKSKFSAGGGLLTGSPTNAENRSEEMSVATRKGMVRGRAMRLKTHTNSPTKAQSCLKRPRTHSQVKYRGAPISRARLRSLRDDLDGTRSTVSDLHEKFWVTSEQDIREMLAKTQQKIARVVGMLERAA